MTWNWKFYQPYINREWEPNSDQYLTVHVNRNTLLKQLETRNNSSDMHHHCYRYRMLRWHIVHKRYFRRTYGDESESDDVDRALIRDDSPLMPPIPPWPTTTTQLMSDNTRNIIHLGYSSVPHLRDQRQSHILLNNTDKITKCCTNNASEKMDKFKKNWNNLKI